jgi:Resolvase, N terminal domain
VVPPIAEFTEIETGKRNDRPQLKEALALCRKRKAKLVIAKLDRLSETNGVAERFFQTCKEQVVHGRIFRPSTTSALPCGSSSNATMPSGSLRKTGYAARAKRGSLGSKPAWLGFAHGCLRGFGMRQNGN